MSADYKAVFSLQAAGMSNLQLRCGPRLAEMVLRTDSSFDFLVSLTRIIISSFVSAVLLLNNDHPSTVKIYEQFLIQVKEYEPEKQSKYSFQLLKDYLAFLRFELPLSGQKINELRIKNKYSQEQNLLRALNSSLFDSLPRNPQH